MIFLDTEQLSAIFDDELTRESAERLETFDIFHCLRGGASLAPMTHYWLGAVPESFRKWLRICNGGLLFDTVMLSFDSIDSSFDPEWELEFDTFDDYNTPEVRAEMALPDGYFIFALRSYGDPICFNINGEGDGRVYRWSIENAIFEEIWDTFEDWLADEIDCGIMLIGDEALLPLEIKMV